MTPVAAFVVLAGLIVALFVGLYWLNTRLDPQDRAPGEVDNPDSGPGHSHSAGGPGDGPSIGPA